MRGRLSPMRSLTGAVFRGAGGGPVPVFVPLSGSSGSYIWAADAAALDITGDIDIRWLVKATDWTPAANRALGGKRNGTGNQRSWYGYVQLTSGKLAWAYSTDGTAETTAVSTVAPSVADGQELYCRITHDVDNGAGGSDVKFWTGTSRDAWTQLGDTVVGGSTVTFFSGSARLEFGSVNAGTAGSPWAGSASWMQVRSGIDGTIVAEFDAARLNGGTSYADVYGNTWTYVA